MGLRARQIKAKARKTDPLHKKQDLWTLALISDISRGYEVVGNWPCKYVYGDKKDRRRSGFVTWAGLNGPPAFYADAVKRLAASGKIKPTEKFSQNDSAYLMPQWFMAATAESWFKSTCLDPMDVFADNWGLEYNYEAYDDGKSPIPYAFIDDAENSWGYWHPIKEKHTEFFPPPPAQRDYPEARIDTRTAKISCPNCHQDMHIPLFHGTYYWVCHHKNCSESYFNDPLLIRVTDEMHIQESGKGRAKYSRHFRVKFKLEFEQLLKAK